MEDILLHISLLGSSLTLVIKGEISELWGFETVDLESQAREPLSVDTCNMEISATVPAHSSFIPVQIFQEKYLILLSQLLGSALKLTN